MTEQNLFLPVAILPLYDDSIGHVTLYDASHSNESEEQRIYTVTTIASLAYGNESAKNPEALYERMQSIKHESLWEFIRIGKPLGASKTQIQNSMRNDMKHYPLTPILNGFEANHKQNIACFRIKVPIFVARQFMRHRSFSYLEMSRRYTKDTKVPFEFWFPQGLDRGDIEDLSEAYVGISKDLEKKYKLHTQVASRFLPQTTYTEYYCMMETEGAKNYFKLRCDSHAQNEIRELSLGMLQLLKIHQPEFYKKVVPNDEIDSRLRDT